MHFSNSSLSSTVDFCWFSVEDCFRLKYYDVFFFFCSWLIIYLCLVWKSFSKIRLTICLFYVNCILHSESFLECNNRLKYRLLRSAVSHPKQLPTIGRDREGIGGLRPSKTKHSLPQKKNSIYFRQCCLPRCKVCPCIA